LPFFFFKGQFIRYTYFDIMKTFHYLHPFEYICG
uniref:NADH dehydrogenase subunit 1 n=1 Tax=Brugia timori TaxID=42155 RepID=A0A0R3QQG7_9BILA